MEVNCNSLEQVRATFDRIDRQLVTLLAERGTYVAAAARFKKTLMMSKPPGGSNRSLLK